MARAGIRVSRNFTMKVDRMVSPRTCREIGLGLLVKIENRTISGRDETGHAFTEYSADYGKYVKGRRRPVDLKRSGDMLKDADVLVADGHRILLGFRSDAMDQRAFYHDSDGAHPKMPKRRFFGLSAVWVEDVVRRIRLGLFADR
jgi:hypothetical protein